MKRTILATALFMMGVALGAGAAELTPEMKAISGTQVRSASDRGTDSFLRLNRTMFELYGDAAKIFAANIRARNPVILALFSGSGGRFILYRQHPSGGHWCRCRCPPAAFVGREHQA